MRVKEIKAVVCSMTSNCQKKPSECNSTLMFLGLFYVACGLRRTTLAGYFGASRVLYHFEAPIANRQFNLCFSLHIRGL
jgi:hypothetical protein